MMPCPTPAPAVPRKPPSPDRGGRRDRRGPAGVEGPPEDGGRHRGHRPKEEPGGDRIWQRRATTSTLNESPSASAAPRSPEWTTSSAPPSSTLAIAPPS